MPAGCVRALGFGAALVLACSRPAQEPRAPLPVANATAPAAQAIEAPAPTSTVAPAPASAPPAAPAPPADCNVILLSIDSLRADMPWSGYPRAIAPRLTELEGKAVSFTEAYAVSSYTSMSLGGLLAGRLPSELRRSGYFFGTYKNNLFFPQLLKKAGIRTMGVMAHFYFRSAGFEAGFDDWRIVPGVTYDANTDRDVTSPQSEKLAEQLLGDPANESRRFFFWAHFLDPHDQYLHHEGIDWGRKARDLYDGEVTFTDKYVGKLVDFIAGQSWAPRTVIIITSDHGEEFGENDMWKHAFEVWEPLVHVPLFFLAPGAAPRRISTRRSAIDLAPTILDLFGVPQDPGMEGQSLVSEIYGAEGQERDVVVDLPMTSDSGRRRALLHGDQKLICFDDDVHCKLYDLRADPGEKAPLIKGEAFKAMKTRYDELSHSIKEVAPYACAADCLNAAYRKKESAP
jgi:arylsulfatase A-like enzyme